MRRQTDSALRDTVRYALAIVLEDSAQSRCRELLQDLTRRKRFSHLKIIVGLSGDVDLKDDTDLLWGFLTRFEPARDLVFPHTQLRGICPHYRGPMGIDATFKEGYPGRLIMPAEIIDRVDNKWASYQIDL